MFPISEDLELLRSRGVSDDGLAQFKEQRRQQMIAAGKTPEEIDAYFGPPTPDMPVLGEPERMVPIRRDIELLRRKGASEEAIRQYQIRRFQDMVDAGKTPAEIDAYFGDTPPDMTRERELIKAGFEADPEAMATGPLAALAAGFQISGTGLTLRGRLPDTILPEEAAFFDKLLYQIGVFVGDLPLTVAGFAGGAAAGAPAGPVGIFTLGGAGSAALPELYRGALIDHYEAALRGEGSIFTADDWTSRLGAIMLETGKAGVAGGLGGRAGQFAASTIARFGGTFGQQLFGRSLTEVTTFTGAFSGLNGEIPDVEDFLVGGAFAIGMFTGSRVTSQFSPRVKAAAQNLMEVYKTTGLTPDEVLAQVQEPYMRQELWAVDPNGKIRPTTLRDLAKPDPEPQKVDGEPRKKPRDYQAEAARIDRDLDNEKITPEVAEARKRALQDAMLDEQARKEVLRADDTDIAALKGEDVPASIKNLSPDEQFIMGRVVESVPRRGSLWQALAEFDPHKAYTRIIREYHPLEILEKQVKAGGVEPEADAPTPAQAFTQTYQSAVRAGYFLRHGAIKYGTNEPIDGPSYFSAWETMKKAGGTAEGFTAYRLAKYTLERSERGIETGIPLDVADRVVKAGEKKYAAAEREIQWIKDRALDYLKDSGVVSERFVDVIKNLNQYHIPMQRLMDPSAPDPTPGRGSGLKVWIPFRKATGSEAKIIDPTMTEIQNFHTIITLADRQRVADITISRIEALARKDPMAAAAIAEKVPAERYKFKLDERELRKVLEEFGAIEPGEPITEFADALGPISVWRAANKAIAPNEIVRFVDGKPEIWAFKDPELAKVFKGADPPETGIIIGLATSVAGLKRAGITLAPDFPIRNILIRDAIQKAILQEGFNPLVDIPKGMYEQFKIGDQWLEFVRNGGAGAAITAMDTNYISRDIHRLYAQTGRRTISNEARNLVDYGRRLTEFWDNSVRLGGFMKDKNRGLPMPKRVERAREGSLDLMQRGSSPIMGLLAKTIPFFRPSLLGVEQVAKGFAADPVGFTLRATAIITLPELALYALNYSVDEAFKDDPDRIAYRTLNRGIRDLYWHVPLPWVGDRGTFFRIPKPYVTGPLFGAVPHRFLDWLVVEDPRAFKDFHQTMLMSLVPSFIPTVIDPFVAIAFDTNLFTGRPLNPASQEQASAYMQYREWHTDTARRLSKLLYHGGVNLTAADIEYSLQSYFGTVPMEAFRILDKAYPRAVTRPAKEWFELPFVRAFFSSNPGMGAQPVTDFYDEYNKVKTRHRDLALAVERMNVLEVDMALEHVDKLMLNLDGIADTNSKLMKLIEGIHRDPEMSATDKRQLIDSQMALIWAASEAGLNMVDQINRSFKDAEEIARGQRQ